MVTVIAAILALLHINATQFPAYDHKTSTRENRNPASQVIYFPTTSSHRSPRRDNSSSDLDLQNINNSAALEALGIKAKPFLLAKRTSKKQY